MMKNYIFIIFLLLSTNLLSQSSFSQEEIEYLKNKKEIKVCIVSGFMPFEDIDKNGKHIGFSSSYFEIFQSSMPIKFKFVVSRSLEESIDFLKTKKCDIVSMVQATSSKKFLYLTQPYIKSPLVVAIKSCVPYITDFNNLKDKKLGIFRGCEYSKNIRSIFPSINSVFKVKSVEYGLKQVAEGKLFGQIGSLAEIGYFFNKNFRGELKIAGKTDDMYLEVRMAIGEDENILFEIMDRLIDGLDLSVHYDIVSKWTAIKYEKGIDFSLVFKLFIIFIIFTLVGVAFLIILKNRNIKLTIVKEEVEYLNRSLEEKVMEEVEKNREKEIFLFQQSRLAQMGELLSMIAHQWRHPLGLINNTITLMQLNFMKNRPELETQKDKDKFFNYLDEKFNDINRYVKFLSNTINNFTNFYRPNKEKELVDITIPIQHSLSMINKILEAKGIVVDINYKTNQAVLLHNNEVMQVILNILKNSKDNFNEKKILNPKIYIETKKDDKNIIINISDNGGGIPKDILHKIFDPYFSTKDEQHGVGIGLYISKIIIQEHNGGTLNVCNIDDGVCFSIIFET